MFLGAASSADITNVDQLADTMLRFFDLFYRFMSSRKGASEFWLKGFDILNSFLKGEVMYSLTENQTVQYLKAFVRLSSLYSSSVNDDHLRSKYQVRVEDTLSCYLRLLDTINLLVEERNSPVVLAAVIVVWATIGQRVTAQEAFEDLAYCNAMTSFCKSLVQLHQETISLPLASKLPMATFSSENVEFHHIWLPLVTTLIHLIEICPFTDMTAIGYECVGTLDPVMYPSLCSITDQMLVTLLNVMLFKRINSEHRDFLGSALRNLIRKSSDRFPSICQRFIHGYPSVNSKLSEYLTKLGSLAQIDYSLYPTEFRYLIRDAKINLPQLDGQASAQ
jgi:hypothetical protein